MNTLSILLTLTRRDAIIEILLLLAVAAIIGYVTAWFFNRSEYRRNMNAMDDELNEVKTQASKLNTENNSLQKKLVATTKKYEKSVFELSALEAKHKEALQEIDDIGAKNLQIEKLLHEKTETKPDNSQLKLLLNYSGFGAAVVAEKDDLQMINGIGPSIEEKLHELDIFTFLQVSKFTKKDISTIETALEYFAGRIERDKWIEQAQELVSKETRKTK